MCESGGKQKIKGVNMQAIPGYTKKKLIIERDVSDKIGRKKISGDGGYPGRKFHTIKQKSG